MKSRNAQKLFLIASDNHFLAYHCNMRECRYLLLQKILVLGLMILHRISRVWQCMSHELQLWKAWELCLLSGPSAHLGFTWPTERHASCTFEPNSWIIKLSIWFQFWFFFLERRGQAGYELQLIHAFLWV